jgi:NTE family protein
MGSSEADPRTAASTPGSGALAGASLLASLPGETIERLRGLAKPVRLAVGEWLFHEGDEADCAYVVRSGSVEVVSDGRIIRTARRGAVIGELAPLTGGTRAASVRGQRDCHLWRLGRDDFEHLITTDQQFALALCRTLGSKLAEHKSPVTPWQPPCRIAILALDGDISSDDIAGRIAAELASAGEVAVLRSGEFASDANHVAAIERAETISRWVLLSGGDQPGEPWTDTALAEADRIIAVSRGLPSSAWIAHAPVLHGCELLILGPSVSDDLIGTLQPSATQTLPDETALRRWLAVTARRLAGRAVGIVFSGGGARAFAHLGVVEELRAMGVRIDRVGGVSMGAVVAGVVGVEMDDATMFETFSRHLVDQNPSGDYTLPAFSLVRGLRTRRLLAEAFGEATIESLPLRFFCVSADLNSRSAVIHRTGRLHEAVFASLAIPGIFPPVPRSDGTLLVDGGMLGNLPVEAMAVAAEGPVIAVDVTRVEAWRPRRAVPSWSWRARARRLITGQDVELPRLGETMLRTLALASSDTVTAARRHADVVIRPAIDGAGLLDWKQLPRMRDAGRIAVRELVETDPGALRTCL